MMVEINICLCHRLMPFLISVASVSIAGAGGAGAKNFRSAFAMGSGVQWPQAVRTENLFQAIIENSGAHGEVQCGKPAADAPGLPETVAQTLAGNADVFGFRWAAHVVQFLFQYRKRHQ